MGFDISRYRAYRENSTIEARNAARGLPDSLWETYSAFANTYGGIILLGVRELEDGSFIPSGLRNSQKVLKDLWNTLNNPNKVSANLLTDSSIELYTESNGDEVIAITVPRAGRTEKPVYIGNSLYGGTFRRGFEGDYRCSRREVNAMLRDAPEATPDMKVIEELSWSDLNQESIRSYRNSHAYHSPNHPWRLLSTEQYLIRIGAAAIRGKGLHPTAAGLLMFGEEHQITQEYPEYFLDYREYGTESAIDWIDRIHSQSGSWTGNLHDFFFMVSARLGNALKSPFRLAMQDGIMTRQDDTPVHSAVREAFANCLTNADFFIPSGVVIQKHPDGIIFSNPGDIRVGKDEMLAGGISDARNKAIMKMFNLLGLGERAGSGVPRILAAWKSEGFPAPSVIEDLNAMRTTLILPFTDTFRRNASDKPASDKPASDKPASDKPASDKPYRETEYERMDEICCYLAENGESITAEIAKEVGLSPVRTRALLGRLCADGQVESTGGNRNRRYRIAKRGS